MKNWIASSQELLAMTATRARHPAMTSKRNTHAQEITDSINSDSYISLPGTVRAFCVGESD
ncbi:hypothetical protein QIG10_27760, partial [Klebsiella pneumoniae]|nr:hypothetical protein [Klebsiella pneumoniae]